VRIEETVDIAFTDKEYGLGLDQLVFVAKNLKDPIEYIFRIEG